jgi:hypothetical protein
MRRGVESPLRRTTNGRERSKSVSEYRGTEPSVSGWAVGGITFAGVIMIILGIFQAIEGLVAIFDDNFYVVAQNYTFDIDTTGWGWIHLLLGILVAATGFALLGRRPWAGIVTIILVALSAIANFFFIPYYPFWSLLMIGLAVWVIWAVTRPGAMETT